MKRYSHWGLLIVLIAALALMGCEGDQGPMGPEGAEGPQGPPGPPGGTSEFTYLGGGGEDCQHCHANTVAQVELTGHTEAYDGLLEKQSSVDNPYCLKCHTTGWDSEVAYGDTEIAVYGPDTFGYDDYWGVEGDEAASRRAMLEGVQCESCHGPMGPEFNSHRPLISFSDHEVDGVSTSLCAQCHSGQIEEWATSGHANAAGGDITAFNAEHYAHVGSCQPCHTAEGFIKANDPAYADYEFPHDVSFVGCVTCHDPHAGADGSGNEAQLRQVGAVEVAYDLATEPGDAERPTMSGYGTAQTCAQCHHARRDDANVAGQIENGYGHFGPHRSNQMDLFIGAGSYVIAGEDYDSTHIHQNIANACVGCHMVRETMLHGELQDHSFHSFTPDVGNCNGCHTTWTDLTPVDTFHAEIDGMMDELAVLFGYTDHVDMEENWDSEAETVENWEREAAYAMFFVIDDGSGGVHNPSYARDLLQNAIDYYEANMPLQ